MSNHTHFIPCTSPWMVYLITIDFLKRNHTLRHCITHRACPHYSRTQDRQNTGFHRGKGDCAFCSGSDAPLLSCSSAHLESLKWAAEHCAQSYRWIIHGWLFALLIYSPHAYSTMVSTPSNLTRCADGQLNWRTTEQMSIVLCADVVAAMSDVQEHVQKFTLLNRYPLDVACSHILAYLKFKVKFYIGL